MLRSVGRALFQAGRAAIMPRMAALLVLLTVLLSSVLTASSSAAHPGGRAADGCHSCRTNCAQWGEVAGERHCHEERQPSRVRQNGQSPARSPQAAEDGSRKLPVEILGSVPRIVDADTLEVAGQKVRLQGIDAPESGQSCRQAGGHRYPYGDQATQALRTRIGPAAVTCTIEGRDRYLRALGICYGRHGPERLAGQAGTRAGLSEILDHVCAAGRAGQGGSGRSVGGRVYQAVGLAAGGTAGLKLTLHPLSDANGVRARK